MSELSFTVLGRPAPQGSMRGFLVGGKVRLTSDNKKTMPYRQEVGWAALRALEGREQPYAAKHVPVKIHCNFCFAKPLSAKKSRLWPVTKPDSDKLVRATLDALKGIAWADDAQVVSIVADKHYSVPERVEITVRILE